MDTARADILAARHRLEDAGWVPRNADAFRHLPPPPAAVWLGEAPEATSTPCDAHPLSGAGWTLHPLVLLFGLSGTLMISKTLRIPKL